MSHPPFNISHHQTHLATRDVHGTVGQPRSPCLAHSGLHPVRSKRLIVVSGQGPHGRHSSECSHQQLQLPQPHLTIHQVTAQHDGMRTMREDGERWLVDGTTTQAELLRVAKD